MKRHGGLWLALLIFCLWSEGQNAKVVPISEEDSARAKQLLNDEAELKKQQDLFHKHMVTKYLKAADQEHPPAGAEEFTYANPPFSAFLTGTITLNGINRDNDTKPPTLEERKKWEAEEKKRIEDRKKYIMFIVPGWHGGEYEFSEDYKYIVPAKPSALNGNGNCISYYGGSLTNVPCGISLTGTTNTNSTDINR